MDDAVGVDWFKNVFLKYSRHQRPQVLILDSDHSHETFGLLEEALKNDIKLIALPPRTTYVLWIGACLAPL